MNHLMEKKNHIGVLVDASRAYGRGIYRGIASFAETRDDWIILAHERPELHSLPQWMISEGLDALIAYVPNDALSRKIRALGIPAVDVHGRCRSPGIPAIESDDRIIVRLGLKFFQQSGFRNLAYCGYPGIFFSDQREEFFRFETKDMKNGYVYSPRVQRRVSEDLYRFEKGVAAGDPILARWLRSLPKPVAILACNDIRGQQLINACREAGIETPEEVAVLGVDDDQIICRLCRPTLSSIEPDTEEIGRLAAQLIAFQLEGERVAAHHLVSPRHIVQRKSTDTVVASHPLVLKATRLIREQGFGNASVDQVCEAAGISRSTLDKLFIRHLGRSVSGEITRLRLQRCSSLLRNTDLPLREIASRCEFASSTYFCRFFKRNTGITPLVYRRT